MNGKSYAFAARNAKRNEPTRDGFDRQFARIPDSEQGRCRWRSGTPFTSSALKSVADQLSNTKFHIEFPGQDPVKLVRRGILMCGASGCDFVMLLPADAAAQAQTPNN